MSPNAMGTMDTVQAPASAHRRDHLRPVIMHDVSKAEQTIQNAEPMIVHATDRDHIEAFHHEQAELMMFQESEEFKTNVEAFRDELLCRESVLTPKTELGKKLALERIERRVKGFQVNLRREMHDKQAIEAAGVKLKPPQIHKSSLPTYAGNEPSSAQNKPRKPSPPRRVSNVQQLATIFGDRPHIELSPTGFATFPRLRDPEEDWDRVSSSETSREEKDKKTTSKKSWFEGWLRLIRW